MSLLSWAAIAVGVIAVIAMGFGLPDSWFCALLALTCMLGGADAAYRELKVWAVAFLTGGLVFTAAAVWSALRSGRAGRGGT
ncbi:hypothetical protein [Streptomyces sp. KR55]|uniref:hypothetical protein n=1 Tax=Streptomyces sp. KR55 TaxID=3457425 RepID=UPI003FD341B6